MQKRMWNMLPQRSVTIHHGSSSHMDFATTLAKTMMIVRVVMVNSLPKKYPDCLRPPLLLVHAHFIYVGRKKVCIYCAFSFILYSNFLSSSVKKVGSFFVRIAYVYVCHIPSILLVPLFCFLFPCRTVRAKKQYKR